MLVNKKKITICGSVTIIFILAFALILLGGPEQDPLVRIMSDINTQGTSKLTDGSLAIAKAHSARMEDGALILYGKDKNDTSSFANVDIYPPTSMDSCSAYKITIEQLDRERPVLRITFHDPINHPRHWAGNTRNIPLEGVGWFRSKLYSSYAYLLYEATFKQ